MRREGQTCRGGRRDGEVCIGLGHQEVRVDIGEDGRGGITCTSALGEGWTGMEVGSHVVQKGPRWSLAIDAVRCMKQRNDGLIRKCDIPSRRVWHLPRPRSSCLQWNGGVASG